MASHRLMGLAGARHRLCGCPGLGQLQQCSALNSQRKPTKFFQVGSLQTSPAKGGQGMPRLLGALWPLWPPLSFTGGGPERLETLWVKLDWRSRTSTAASVRSSCSSHAGFQPPQGLLAVKRVWCEGLFALQDNAFLFIVHPATLTSRSENQTRITLGEVSVTTRMSNRDIASFCFLLLKWNF